MALGVAPPFLPHLLSSLTVSPGSPSSIKLLHESLSLKPASWGSSPPGPQNLRAGPCYSGPINTGTPSSPSSSILLPKPSVVFWSEVVMEFQALTCPSGPPFSAFRLMRRPWALGKLGWPGVSGRGGRSLGDCHISSLRQGWNSCSSGRKGETGEIDGDDSNQYFQNIMIPHCSGSHLLFRFCSLLGCLLLVHSHRLTFGEWRVRPQSPFWCYCLPSAPILSGRETALEIDPVPSDTSFWLPYPALDRRGRMRGRSKLLEFLDET